MKKLLFAFSISSILAGTASAQSSVTLYGIVTGNITYANNVQTAATSGSGKPLGGAQVAQFDSGSSGLASSRLGLTGADDLGGGLKAIFKIENGFSVNNGTLAQGCTEFGRQALVGLTANRYGTVTLGRQGDTSVEFVSPLLYAWYWGNLAIHPSDYDNLNFTHRINNSIKYLSDPYNGFRFGALYSLGGVAGNVTQNQFWSTGASYRRRFFVCSINHKRQESEQLAVWHQRECQRHRQQPWFSGVGDGGRIQPGNRRIRICPHTADYLGRDDLHGRPGDCRRQLLEYSVPRTWLHGRT